MEKVETKAGREKVRENKMAWRKRQKREYISKNGEQNYKELDEDDKDLEEDRKKV